MTCIEKFASDANLPLLSCQPLRVCRAPRKLASREKRTTQGESVFVICALARTTPRENPLRYDGLASGATVYAYVGGDPLMHRDPSGKLIPEAIVGGLIGGAVGYIAGRISGDTGDQLTNDIVAGAGTGFLAGLTDGASILESAAGDALAKGAITTAISTGLEVNRQYQNYGCVKSVQDVILAGALGAAGSVASGSAIRAFSGAELSLGQSTAVAANAGIGAGAFTMGYSSLEKDQESESTQCECKK